MKALERFILSGLQLRMQEKRRFIQVLAGPRQVGKTTMVHQLLSRIGVPSHFVSADAVTSTNWLEQQWQAARIKRSQSSEETCLLVIDEVQKLHNWSETVKLLWDEDSRLNQNIKVILLGSSRLLLQQGLTESLAGRFELTYVPHWSYSEMHETFGWTPEQFAWFGGYPGAADLIHDEARWKDYVLNSLIETSISKDILMLTRVDKPALMKRLFEFGCDYSSQILSYTKMLGQLLDAGNTTTLSHYLELLDTAGLLCGLEKFSAGKIRQRASSPKFQVHNTALMSAQKGEHFGQFMGNPILKGRVIESAVGAHLLNHSITERFKLSYWREGNQEVDFVIEKDHKILGIEVKSGYANRVKGKGAFQKQYPDAKTIVLEQSGVSWEEFLKMNPAQLFGIF